MCVVCSVVSELLFCFFFVMMQRLSKIKYDSGSSGPFRCVPCCCSLTRLAGNRSHKRISSPSFLFQYRKRQFSSVFVLIQTQQPRCFTAEVGNTPERKSDAVAVPPPCLFFCESAGEGQPTQPTAASTNKGFKTVVKMWDVFLSVLMCGMPCVCWWLLSLPWALP